MPPNPPAAGPGGMWSDQPHQCAVPVDQIPDEVGWMRFWTCDWCRTEYRLSTGARRPGPGKFVTRVTPPSSPTA